MRFRTFLSIFLLFSAVSMATEKEATLRVVVDNIPSLTGRLRLALFKSAAGFPGNAKKAYRRLSGPINERAITVEFGPVPPGSYAVSVYQDLNDNGALDTSFLRIPKEPVGFSQNQKIRRGPPSFKDCQFTIGREDQTIFVHLLTRDE